MTALTRDEALERLRQRADACEAERQADEAEAAARSLREQAEAYEQTAEQLRADAAVTHRRTRGPGTYATDLWLCGAVADTQVEAWRAGDGILHRHLEHVVYACPTHEDQARAAVPYWLTAHQAHRARPRRNCGERFDYTTLGAERTP